MIEWLAVAGLLISTGGVCLGLYMLRLSLLEIIRQLNENRATFAKWTTDQQSAVEDSDALWDERMDELDAIVRELRPDAFQQQVTQLREFFINVFQSLLTDHEARLNQAISKVGEQSFRLSEHHGELLKHRQQLEAQWHRLDMRVRAITNIVDSFRLVRTGTAADAGSTDAPITEPDLVEVVSPEGTCELYPMPARPDEPVHPEIQHALHTPGWKIRYPDGRVELGVQ